MKFGLHNTATFRILDCSPSSDIVFNVFILFNEPVDYMARAVLILMRAKDITRAIGRFGP